MIVDVHFCYQFTLLAVLLLIRVDSYMLLIFTTTESEFEWSLNQEII
jgi:hypothetical protein